MHHYRFGSCNRQRVWRIRMKSLASGQKREQRKEITTRKRKKNKVWKVLLFWMSTPQPMKSIPIPSVPFRSLPFHVKTPTQHKEQKLKRKKVNTKRKAQPIIGLSFCSIKDACLTLHILLNNYLNPCFRFCNRVSELEKSRTVGYTLPV